LAECEETILAEIAEFVDEENLLADEDEDDEE
jgi:hypothetical protein